MFARSNSFFNTAVASWLLIPGVWLAFHWPVLSGQQQFGFRDTGSLYYPMFHWIDQQWESGRNPFWNPLDDFGVSVVGDTSSSLFYPGKIIFLARSFSFDLRFAWYVSLHVLLAAVGARIAAHSIGCRPVASSLVGISYAFGGTVLFQTCNVIFLVGSAWLPFTLAAVWYGSKSNRNQNRWLLLAAISLAMMVLGGDPQMAFMAGLTSIALLWTNPRKRTLSERWVAPFVIASGAIALSAVQVLPSLNWLSTSERSSNSASGSIWSALLHGDFSGLIAEPQPGTHAAAVYEFSFAPWRVVESIWPNVLGKFDFATETVWASQLAGADRLWTPSIYFSVVVFLLAVIRMRWRRSTDENKRPDRQLTWIMIFFLFGSFGWYGLGWFINEIQLMRGGGGLGNGIGEPVGSIYWWLVTWLPGFSSFRYPAKLLTIAALSACLLGGRGFDSLVSCSDGNGVRRITRCAVGIGVVAALFASLILLIGFRQVVLSPDAAIEVLIALIHSTVVLGIFCLILHYLGSLKNALPQWLILLLCVADLFVANQGLTGLVAAEDMTVTGNNDSVTFYRNPEIDLPIAGGDETMSLAYVSRLDRLTLRPRIHWLSNRRVLGSFASIEQLDVQAWKHAVANLDEAGRKIVLESCGVEQTVDSIHWDPGESGKAEVTIHRTQLDGLPRFRLVDSWLVLSEIDNDDPTAVAKRTSDILDLQITHGPELVVVEPDQPFPSPPASMATGRFGRITIVSNENARVELEIDAEQDCLLLANDYFGRNWTAIVSNDTYDNKPVTIMRANRLMRALPLIAGKNRVTFQFRIPEFRTGIAITALAWVLSILILIRRTPVSAELR